MNSEQARARKEIARAAVERSKRLAAFRAKPGWRVAIETFAGNEPLWPRGFDPLNVKELSPGLVLHTRFLRLGNGLGAVEILGAEALTEAAGSHPLFQGVRRVVVVALSEPVVTSRNGEVRVEAEGLTAAFTGATVRREGKSMTIQLRP